MSDHHDWDASLSALDEVRPTPPDVKKRIRQRALSGTVARGDEIPGRANTRGADWAPVFDPGAENLDVAPFELIPTDAHRPLGRRRRIGAALAVAAASLVGAVLWLGWPDQPESDVAASAFPNRSSELACQELLFASEELAFLAGDGPTPLTVEQLSGLSSAFAAFVDELDVIGFTDSEVLRAWRDASAELRQAAIFAGSGDTTASALLLEQARGQIFNLVWNSDHRVVESCFEGFTR